MKITQLWIDGYGRFSGRHLTLAPGLQVIAGPNERGKSTVRSFICEMLYGQKRSLTQRLYDPTHELRTPWDKLATYGGRIEYELEDGTTYEVQRVFDRKNESISVFDRTNAEDVTATFPVLKNRETTFAEVQLGISRPVFLNVATISHSSLAELGDEDALGKIREKLSSMTDTGDVDHSTETALKWLSARITAIGQKNARKKPLPVARARLAQLQQEYGDVRAARHEVARLEADRVEVLERIDELTRARDAREAQMANLQQQSRADRLQKAEALGARIDELTQACFALGDVRSIDAEDVERVRELAPTVDAARRQAAVMEQERLELDEKVATETERLGPDDAAAMADPDPAQEERLAELDAQIRRANERLAELEESLQSLTETHEGAREKLVTYPDFSRLSSDPVEWLTQLASSFNVARKTRESEREQFEKLEEAVSVKRAATEEPEAIFSSCEDFPALARAHHAAHGESNSAMITLERETEELHATADDIESRLPGIMLITLLSVSLGIVTGLVAYMTNNIGIYIATVCSGAAALYFAGLFVLSQKRVRDALERLEEIDLEEQAMSRDRSGDGGQIQKLLEQFGCDSVRELEALYDHYKANALERDLLVDQQGTQEARLRESEERVAALYERLESTFRTVNESIENEDDVEAAATRAISRYQEYRETKRRANETRDVLKVRTEEFEGLAIRIEALKEEERALALTIRQFLRDNHYPEEAKNDSALAALRGYRLRAAQVKQRRGQLELYEDKQRLIDSSYRAEVARADEAEQELARLFEKAGATDLEQFRVTVEKAVQYRELRQQIDSLEEQLATVLDGQELAALRARVEEESTDDIPANVSASELEEELRRVTEELEATRKHEHELHLRITERVGGLRTLNEVEEERDAVARNLQELELELQATTYAMSVLEEVTRERHSRVAPRLAERASGYLAEITDGAYSELLINRDLNVTVRLPETQALHEQPEQALSKGTVDQIYLALRLAMVDSITAGAEPVPMLLDDPFANYDDARLDRAMQLLQRVAESHQILFFTCRDDVVAAADAVNAPIIQL